MAASLDSIEQVLSGISAQLGGFANNKNYDQGLEKVEKTLDQLKSFYKKSSIQNSHFGAQTSTGSSLGFTIGRILGTLEKINSHFSNGGSANVATKVSHLNTQVDKAVSLLEQINQHIGNNPSNTTVNGNTTNTTPINNIDKNVEEIRDVIKSIATVLVQHGTFSTNDDSLNKLIYENLKKSEQLKSGRLDQEEKEKKARDDAYSGNTEGYKNLLRDKRNKDKKLKELEKQVDKEFEGGAFKKGIRKILGTDPSNTKAENFSIATGSIIKGGTSLLTEKPDASKTIDKGISMIGNFGPYGQMASSILSAVKALYDLGSKQDKLTTELSRNIGGNQTGKRLFGEAAQNLIKTAPSTRGYTSELAYGAMNEIAEARGRTTERLSSEAIGSAIDLKRFGIGAEAINNFDTFGKSIEETDKYFAKLYNEVSKKGLSFKNVSKAVNDNLKAAQSHTFANGLRGLEQMAERSVQLKYNMQQVFQFADKVSEIEGAIGTAANLSVLGGTFAQYSNPMQLLYEGLNDSEALQKRIEGMFGDKAFWNSQTKQIDMSAMDKEFVKQAAKAAGLNPDEMLSMSYNQAKMRRVESQIGPGLGKDTTEYIKNIAELDENGNAMVTLDGVTKAVSELNETDKELLKKESERKAEADNAKLGNIYDKTRSINERMDNLLTYVQEKLGRWVYNIFQKIVGREEANREKVREWAAQNGKDEKSALEFFEKNHNKATLNSVFNPNSKGHIFTGYDDKYFVENMDEMVKRFGGNIQGKSPNGFSPLIPGNSGIYNGQLKGKTHLNGGILGEKNGVLWEAENNEWLINGLSSLKYKDIMPKIQNGTFNPYSYANDLIKNDMGKHLNSLNVAPVQNKPNSANQPNSSNAINGKIKVDIPQTITIKLENGTNIGELDTNAITSMVALKIMQEWKKMENLSGFNKEDFPYKNVIA